MHAWSTQVSRQFCPPHSWTFWDPAPSSQGGMFDFSVPMKQHYYWKFPSWKIFAMGAWVVIHSCSRLYNKQLFELLMGPGQAKPSQRVIKVMSCTCSWDGITFLLEMVVVVSMRFNYCVLQVTLWEWADRHALGVERAEPSWFHQLLIIFLFPKKKFYKIHSSPIHPNTLFT